jgi:hypothetical protein
MIVNRRFERNSRMVDLVAANRFDKLALPDVNPVITAARSLTPNDEHANDVVQKTYLWAFRIFRGSQNE